MLKKVKPIKLGRQVYRRLMKRVLERDGWQCQKCGFLDMNYDEEKCQVRKIGRIQRKAKEGVLVVILTPAVAQEKPLGSAT